MKNDLIINNGKGIIFELLEKIQKLEKENKRILDHCNKIADKDGQDYANLLKENKKLKDCLRKITAVNSRNERKRNPKSNTGSSK